LDGLVALISAAGLPSVAGGATVSRYCIQAMQFPVDPRSIDLANDTVQCPVCDFNYLHQSKISILDRGDLVQIAFSCEGCSAISTLQIYQCKGQTFISWE
jgi:hypothetical protein